MNPSWHIFLGFLFSVFLFLFFPEAGMANFVIIFISSVLIDVDHYFLYIHKKKSFSLRKAYIYSLEHKKQWQEFGKDANYDLPPAFFIFHGLEMLLILFVLSFFFKPLYFVFIGFSFHLLLDLVEQAVYSNKFQKISIVNDFLNYRN